MIIIPSLMQVHSESSQQILHCQLPDCSEMG